MSYTSSEASEQVVRMTLNTAEVAVKLSGKAAERIAVLLYAVLRGQKKTKGKIRLTNLLKSGKELKVFEVRDSDLSRFCHEAKKYGVLYCVLKDKKANDGKTDVMVRAEDASKINRIFERFSIATTEIASARSEITRAKEEQRKTENDTDIPVPDRSSTEKDREEAFLDELLSPVPDKEQEHSQNPTLAPTAKSRRSEPISKRREQIGKGFSETESRPSVRAQMDEIREEQRQKAELSQKTKDTQNIGREHSPAPAKKKNEKEKSR